MPPSTHTHTHTHTRDALPAAVHATATDRNMILLYINNIYLFFTLKLYGALTLAVKKEKAMSTLSQSSTIFNSVNHILKGDFIPCLEGGFWDVCVRASPNDVSQHGQLVESEQYSDFPVFGDDKFRCLVVEEWQEEDSPAGHSARALDPRGTAAPSWYADALRQVTRGACSGLTHWEGCKTPTLLPLKHQRETTISGLLCVCRPPVPPHTHTHTPRPTIWKLHKM